MNYRQPTILDRLSDSAILKKIERQPKSTAGFKQLVRELGLHGAARQELSERLQRLINSGQLVQIDSDRYAIPKAAASKNVLVGKAEHASRWLRFCHSRCRYPRPAP